MESITGGFHYLSAGIDEHGQEVVSLEDAVTTQLIREYGAHEKPLPIVAITDGAKAIRTSLLTIFGKPVTIILDWYHLSHKVTTLMSLIARTKAEKESHLAALLVWLWRGNTPAALEYLDTQVSARNSEKLGELRGYLDKHQEEIIDYERRQDIGKTIGSGRMEKAVDQVIGHRQKKKGMSWSRVGSQALAILKVTELNGLWKHHWQIQPLPV